jgi:aminoglycoside N3'-acetyltransferase
MKFFNQQRVSETTAILTDHILKLISESPSNVHWLSVDLRYLLITSGAKISEVKPLILNLYQTIVDRLPNDQTLLVSTFNFDFSRKGSFNIQKDPGQTGAFGHHLIDKYYLNRIRHPFYSFIVAGNKKGELLSRYFKNSTGKNSIFEWIVDQNTQLICVGHHYVKSLTSIHHAEHVVGVSYRYPKSFFGQLITPTEIRAIESTLYVRDIDICDFSSLTLAGDRYFHQQELVKIVLIKELAKPVVIESIHHLPAFQLMVENLTKNDTESFIDYFGSQYNKQNVISGSIADKLHLKHLRSFTM